jgi:hypothetical protein
MGTFAWVLAAEEVAAADMGMAVSLSVHILSQLCIFASGSDEQKERFLPPMTAGRELGGQDPGEGAHAGAAVALGVREAGDAELAGALEQASVVSLLLVALGGTRGDLALRPVADGVADGALFLGQRERVAGRHRLDGHQPIFLPVSSYR